MEKQLFIKNSIIIKASATKVWDVLTKPEQTKKYMFGCEAISDWNVGSKILWKAVVDGKEKLFVKGNIVSIEPRSFLAYTTFDPNNTALDDTPENYLTVTYELTAQGKETILTVTQGDYAAVADGEKRYEESSNNGEGWNPILVQIKRIAEEK